MLHQKGIGVLLALAVSERMPPYIFSLDTRRIRALVWRNYVTKPNKPGR